jgi:hypothetical protein
MAREMSETTRTVRKFLDKHGDTKFKEAQPALEKLGLNVTDQQYNAIKYQWSVSKDKVAEERSLAAVSADDALAFVKECGGQEKARSFVREAETEYNRRKTLLEKFDEIAALVK